MNFGKLPTREKLNFFTSNHPRRLRHLGVSLFRIFLILIGIILIIGGFTCAGIFRGITDSAPDISTINLNPSGEPTTIYDSDGNAIQTLVMDTSNQKDVSYEAIPKNLINAIITVEDPGFFYHNGVDFKEILRSFMGTLTSGTYTEGPSTITQQLIKNGLFNNSLEQTVAEKVERGIQEQYLALQLENKLSKKTILEHYLNSINLGSNIIGIQAASRRYFNKDVSELTLSECTVIAAIAQNPSLYNPVRRPEQNASIRKSILTAMLNNQSITQSQYATASTDDVYSRIQTVDPASDNILSGFTYYTEEVFNVVLEDLQDKLGYTETQAYNLLYGGGLSIYTTMDSDIQAVVDEEVNNAANYPDEEFSLNYSLTVTDTGEKTTSYNESDIRTVEQSARNRFDYNNLYKTDEEMQTVIDEFKATVLSNDSIVTQEVINKIPQPQASMVMIDQSNGHVLALSGGRQENSANITYNRATDSLRQPGSCFQVLTSFAPALDVAGSTLATTYYDAPYTVNGQTFSNWWGNDYRGYANIRQGIQYSMNIVAAKCLVQTVSPAIGYDYATNFGISSLSIQDKVPSLAAGSTTNGVNNLELTNAYAVIANKGVYHQPVFYTKITDHNGRTILENTSQSRSVLKESTAALLTDAMANSVSDTNTWNGLSPSGALCHVEGIDIAGSAGFASDSQNLWFIGYSPYVTCGIWSGYDNSQTMTSSDYHKLIWQKVMSRVHENLPAKSFTLTSDIETAKICSKSGMLAIDKVCDHSDSNSIVYTELFDHGTAPIKYCDLHVKVNICMESGSQAGPECPKEQIRETVYLNLDSLETGSYTTEDSDYTLPNDLLKFTCPIHSVQAASTKASAP